MPSQLDILGWNRPTIIYLLYNAQPPGYIGVKQTKDYLLVIQCPARVKQSNDYLLVIQCPANWIYWGETDQRFIIQCPANWIYWDETDQWLVTEYPANWDILGWNRPMIIYLLYNAHPAGYIRVKQSKDYLFVLQCPTTGYIRVKQCEDYPHVYLVTNLLVTSGWNSQRIIHMFI